MSSRRPSARLLVASLILVLACQTAPERIVVDELRAQRSRDEIVQRFQALRARVFRIGYLLRSGGRRFCGGLLAPDAGVLLGTLDGVDASGARNDVPSSSFTDGLRVLHVVPGSVLDQAGVRNGDVLLDLAGAPLTRVEDLSRHLARIPEAEPARFRIARDATAYTIERRIPRICAVPIHFSEDPGLMTFQQGHSVAVPFGLIEAVDDTQLAMAISHQLAHALLGFATQPVADVEATADRLGLLIAAESGFPVSAAPAFWEWLASENPWRIGRGQGYRVQRPHPFLPNTEIEYPAAQLHLGIAARLPAIRADVSEIERALARE